MKLKYIGFGIAAFVAVVGWNAFLIQRDDALFRANPIELLKQPPSNKIGYSPKERYCQQQAHWHPDCNVE
jgi:hypothetical protein